jgi:hypothetical protein
MATQTLGRRATRLGPPWLLLTLLVLASTACDANLGGATNQRYNAVRRAAVAYELRTRGPADELLVDFGFLEWRDNLGFTSGRTVWLNPIAPDEFFSQRDPGRSYIYLRTPTEHGDDVLIEVERSGAQGVHTRQLTLRQSGGVWQVVADEALR